MKNFEVGLPAKIALSIKLNGTRLHQNVTAKHEIVWRSQPDILDALEVLVNLKRLGPSLRFKIDLS